MIEIEIVSFKVSRYGNRVALFYYSTEAGREKSEIFISHLYLTASLASYVI